MNHAPDPFGGLPHFAERVHAGFEATLSIRDESNLARYEEEAVATLQTMLTLEEQSAKRKDEESEHAHEFLRLERKLDLVIALLSTRLSGDQGLPEREVHFSAEGARWPMADQPPIKVGTPGLVRLWLHRALPRPLVLPAEVMADEPGRFRVGFLHLGIACEDLLVRYVFLQHRRRVAGARRWSKRSAG